MGMFIAYLPLSDEVIDKSAEENIPLLEKWFADNPGRETCAAQFWYGRMVTINRGDSDSIRQQVLDAATEAKANPPGGRKDDEEA